MKVSTSASHSSLYDTKNFSADTNNNEREKVIFVYITSVHWLRVMMVEVRYANLNGIADCLYIKMKEKYIEKINTNRRSFFS